MRYIITRSDNLGDMIITLPIVEAIKSKDKDAYIIVCARNYVKDIVKLCPLVDEFIAIETLELITLKKLNIDIAYFPQVEINTDYALLFKQANITQRIGMWKRDPMKILTQNIPRLLIGRYRHEAVKNFALLRSIGVNDYPSVSELANQQSQLFDMSQLHPIFDSNQPYVVLHTQSNKHGREWIPEYFTELKNRLNERGYIVVLTGSETEYKVALEKCPQLFEGNIINAFGKYTMLELASILKYAKGTVASGTGPLHLSAALDTLTIGLYPPFQGANIQRWQALGNQVICLEGRNGCSKPWHQFNLREKYCHTIDASCACMQNISVNDVLSYLPKRTTT